MFGLEETVSTVAGAIQLVFEAASILVVAAGGVAFLLALFKETGRARWQARWVLAKYLVVALELQLAADIIATASDPSLQELGKLAAIAVIRTFLNYFLNLELREEKAGNEKPS